MDSSNIWNIVSAIIRHFAPHIALVHEYLCDTIGPQTTVMLYYAILYMFVLSLLDAISILFHKIGSLIIPSKNVDKLLRESTFKEFEENQINLSKSFQNTLNKNESIIKELKTDNNNLNKEVNYLKLQNKENKIKLEILQSYLVDVQYHLLKMNGYVPPECEVVFVATVNGKIHSTKDCPSIKNPDKCESYLITEQRLFEISSMKGKYTASMLKDDPISKRMVDEMFDDNAVLALCKKCWEQDEIEGEESD